MAEQRKAVIGSEKNFWIYSSTDGYDLTHPAQPSARVQPSVTIKTTTDPVTIDPEKTALVIIDMQNFFLSPSLGRPRDGKGIKASEQLLKHAIPACRKASIRVMWLNWGLTWDDISKMPPATIKSFGFSTYPAEAVDRKILLWKGHNTNPGESQLLSKDPRIYKGLGSEIGPITTEDESVVEGGRLLMRNQWNTELYPPLEEARQKATDAECKPEDVWIHKDRMSGMWGGETECTKYLESAKIQTLIFAGVNTDQCVGGSLQDAYTKGYDCLLLSDGSATTGPDSFQQCIETNTAKIWGFVLSCASLAEGVENMSRPSASIVSS